MFLIKQVRNQPFFHCFLFRFSLWYIALKRSLIVMSNFTLKGTVLIANKEELASRDYPPFRNFANAYPTERQKMAKVCQESDGMNSRMDYLRSIYCQMMGTQKRWLIQ